MDDRRAPPTRRLLAEVGAAGEWAVGQVAWRSIAARHRGDGRPVLVLPGFLTYDWMTATLRRTLAAAGYRPHGWGLGLNRGISAALLDAMLARLAAAAAERPAALVGWSLGGLYARELARRVPHQVERVVTLGTPFSGDMRANNAWRLYERVAGHPVDAPPIAFAPTEKPPVPTTALWSARDGIVAPAAARGQPGERDAAAEVDCTHLGFTSAPAALRAVLAALAT